VDRGRDTSGVLAVANIVALRGWEISCIGMWAVGLWLVFRLGASRLHLGLYTGASGLAFWDWMLGNRWFFHITFDDRFVTFFRVDGLVEPLWAGFSYGFFFGICALLAVHFGRWLDEHLGGWQYLAIGLALGFLDIVIEGISVGWLELYRFNYQESYLWWGVPWTNIVFIVTAQVPIIFLARRLGDLVARVEQSPAVPTATRHTEAGPPIGVGGGAAAVAVAEAPSAQRAGWLPFWAALPIAPAGIYVGAFVTTLLLQRLEPWVPLR
jgi:hypothetical protein